MKLTRRIGLLVLALLPVVAGSAPALAEAAPSVAGAVFAQESGTRDGRLAPRYEAPPPEEPRRYNSDYMFGMTRGVADSTMHAAIKGPLFLLTVPLDVVFLPVTAIAGIFG